jgi:hypothetical protein
VATAWHVDHRPSEQQRADFAPSSADARYTGGGVALQFFRDRTMVGYGLRGGASLGNLTGDQLDAAGRLLAFAEARGRLTITLGGGSLSLLATGMGTTGQTNGESWTRTLTSGGMAIGTSRLTLRGDALLGNVTLPAEAEFGRAWEQFLVGGSAVPYFDRAYISQRIPLPGVPAGYGNGRRVGLYRASIGGLSWEPYMNWIAAGDELENWKRIVGLERSLVVPALGFARLPEIRARVGASFTLDAPYRQKGRAYVSLTYSP